MTMEKDPDRLSAMVVDNAFHIHADLGRDCWNPFYASVLTRAVQRQGLKVEREKIVVFEFDGMQFNDGLRIDLLVNEVLVVELKSVEAVAAVHFKQLLTYLRLMNLPLGLLINFGAATFKEGCRRVVNNHHPTENSLLRINKGRT